LEDGILGCEVEFVADPVVVVTPKFELVEVTSEREVDTVGEIDVERWDVVVVVMEEAELSLAADRVGGADTDAATVVGVGSDATIVGLPAATSAVSTMLETVPPELV